VKLTPFGKLECNDAQTGSCPRSETATRTDPVAARKYVQDALDRLEGTFGIPAWNDPSVDAMVTRDLWVAVSLLGGPVPKQRTGIACRTWEPVWRDEYMQYSYDRGVFEGAAILDGLVGMGIAIGQRRPTAPSPAADRTRAWEWLRKHTDSIKLEGLTWMPMIDSLDDLLREIRLDERQRRERATETDEVRQSLADHQKLVRERDEAVETLIRLGHPEAAKRIVGGTEERCSVCQGSGNIWLGPPGNKYRADCYTCGGRDGR
jgi:hypothetical protein